MVRIVDLADGFSSATAPDTGGVVPQITFIVANNTTADVTSFSFNNSDTIQALVIYHVSRDTDSISRLDQSGACNVWYDGASWQLSEAHIDGEDAGFELGISAGGQVTYTTSNLVGANYIGTLSIRAESLEAL